MAILCSLEKIWGYAEHNAFADLIFYRGSFFCALRESDEHAGGVDGQIRILSSTDAKFWKPVALLSVKGIDLRDPMLSEMPDGRLMLSMGGSVYENDKYLGRNPCVSFSNNGIDWGPIHKLNMPEEWVWRVTWYKGVGYGGSYRSDKENKTPWILTLFKTTTGLEYTPITQLDVSHNPSETTLRFTSDGTMIALVRRVGNGWIGSSKPPYTQWTWFETEYRFGGPNFIIMPDGSMWAGSRLHAKIKPHMQTALFKMSLNSYEPALILPSEGDTSYPGMVYRNGLLYMCYYSSHEGKANVYLATIDLGKELRGS